MRYGFINNFSQLLASDLAIDATTMTLGDGGALLANASADLVYTLTLIEMDGQGDEVGREIVRVTAASGNDLTIVRAQEGTTAQAWPTGTDVEMRATAGALSAMLGDRGAITTGSNVFASGSAVQVVGDDVVALGAAEVGGSTAVAIGQSAGVGQWSNQNIDGTWTMVLEEGADFTTAVGPWAKAVRTRATALGYATAQGLRSIAVGYSTAWTENSVVIGDDSQAGGLGAIALGAGIFCQAYGAVSIGPNSSVFGVSGIALGSYANADVPYTVAIGVGCEVEVSGGYRCNALPYAAKDPDNHYANLFSGFSEPNYQVPKISRRNSGQVVIVTDPLDLTNDTAAVTLDLLSGTQLFVDSIDVVITGSNDAGGSPEVSVGPDDQTPAAYLAATLVGKTAVGGRESHAPLITDGVSSLRVTTTVAGTGTTYQAKIVFRGYVMEL